MQLYGNDGMLALVIALLQREGRVSYWALKQEFGFDDAFVDGLKDELILAKRIAIDEGGKVLVWTGAGPPAVTAAIIQHAVSDTAAVTATTAPSASPLLVPEAATTPAVPMTPLPGATPVVVRAPEAERRQVTVLFCDLVGSTTLSQQLDAEDYRTVVRAYQEAAVAALQPFDGYVAQYLGDGLLVYFGWPQAHEDAALRAVYASLALVDALGPLNSRLAPQYRVQVAVRCGLHTGLAVIGAMGSGPRQEPLAMGDTPNIAARLQGLAALNTVVCSAVTGRLIQRAFALEDLGRHRLKGLTEPLAVCRVLGPVEGPPGEEETAAPTPGLFLVGRDEEVGLLRRRWEQSTEGLGQVVLLSGEAGIGKTALVQTLRVHVGRAGSTRLTFRCSPYHTHSALYPVIEHVQRVVGLARNDTPKRKLDKLARVVGTSRLLQADVLPLLAALLSISVPEGQEPAVMLTPQQQKQQTLDALVAWLTAEAERQPVLAVWEDLHWADPSTLDMLGLVLEQTPTVPMLTVLTFRPDFVPPWPMRSHMTPMTLNRLERPQVEGLITHLTEGKALPAEVVQHIVAKTDGVPLFVEELTKMLLECGLLREEAEYYALTGPLSRVTIPAMLQDSLMARLERLPAVKEVAQLGAVCGREFPYEMLRAIVPLDETTLQARLARLVAAELLYQRGRPPRARYIFKHALIQEVAYQSMLKSTRQQVHRQVATLVEAQFPELVEAQPELVAQHYTEAGCTEQAILYWQRAGQQALQRSANPEAVQHLTTGLGLLATLPETPARVQQELDLQLALGSAWMATKGTAAPEVEQTYARARALCTQVGDTLQLFPALWGLCRFCRAQGALQTARELGEQLYRLAQREAEPMHRLEAHEALGSTLFFLGEYTAAWTHLEQGSALTDPTAQRAPGVPL